MSEFDKIIGYESVKEELRQLCDMIHNADVYEKLGAKLPKGLLIYGVPGVGKSLMAKSFIKESDRKSYIIRRNKHGGDFINEIKNVFTEAAQNTPSIILLDDMDKFVVEEGSREEYVAIQACIDEVSLSDVYVLATANTLRDIPDSLLRAGRFDRKIEVEAPMGEDAVKIIQHYVKSKKVVASLNVEDVAKMLHGRSCADLETLLNEAAIYAGFERCESISMEHIVRATLRNEYGANDSCSVVDTFSLKMAAYHEAGHVVISELLNPNSVGLASIKTRGKSGRAGFITRSVDRLSDSQDVLVLLAGKAAAEMKFGIADNGGRIDLGCVVNHIISSVSYAGTCGIGALDIYEHYQNPSNDIRAKQEGVIHAEIERYLMQTKMLLTNNWGFLNAVATALLEKRTLLHSDIQKLKSSCDITAHLTIVK